MNEFFKTGAFVAVAVGVGVFAYATLPGGVENALFDDQGEILFEGFTSADQAASIEVYGMQDGELEKFIVAREGDTWTIPSHFGYPADANEQMAEAATLLIGLEKARVRSDAKSDHADFGVLDPREDVGGENGYGQRVIFKSESEAELADLIIGSEVPGGTGMRFVREPGKKRVYEVEIAKLVPTNFEEWIEQDVLTATQAEIAKIKWDNYSVDETRGAVVPGPEYSVEKDESGQWMLMEQPVKAPAGSGNGEEGPAGPPAPVAADAASVQAAAGAVAGLSIVGVRPKPKGLNADLLPTDNFAYANLQGMGYFFNPNDKKLYSNEGDLLVHTNNGVRYTLRFGEIVRGSGKSVSAGTRGGEEGEEGTEEDGRPNRYLMVSVALDEDSFVKPEGVAIEQAELAKRSLARNELEEIRRAVQAYKDRNDGALPDDLTKLTEVPEEGEALLAELKDDPWGHAYQFAKTEAGFNLRSFGADSAEGGEGNDADVDLDMLSRENDLQRYAGALQAYESKLAEAKKKVESLTKRFGPWYYVIDATSYDKLRPAMEDLVKKDDPVEGSDTDGQTPPFGGFTGLPGGGNGDK